LLARLVGDDDDAHVTARLEAAEQYFFGQWLLNVLLDHEALPGVPIIDHSPVNAFDDPKVAQATGR
jgi:hypothetical protein